MRGVKGRVTLVRVVKFRPLDFRSVRSFASSDWPVVLRHVYRGVENFNSGKGSKLLDHVHTRGEDGGLRLKCI